jgi:hypothetical protein
MSISFMSVISVNNEPVQILTSIHNYITYGKINTKVDIGDIVKIANSDVLGKVKAITKESIMVQWNGVKETSILPLFLAENILQFVEHNPRVFDIIIVAGSTDVDEKFWYNNEKGRIFKATIDNTMFYVNNFEKRGDYLETGGIFTNHARIIDASKSMSLNPAKFFLEMTNEKDEFAVSDKGVLITRDKNGVVYECSYNGSLIAPLVLTKEVQDSKWYLCKNKIE